MTSGSPSGKSILFVINEAGEFVELRRVALAAKQAGYSINFLFASASYVNLRQDRAFCRLNGFSDFFPGRSLRRSHLSKQYASISQGLDNGYAPHSLKNATRPRISKLAMWSALILSAISSPIIRLSSKLNAAADARKERRSNLFQPFNYARNVYNKIRPSLVVFGQEFPGSINSLLIRMCNNDKVPTLIVPFAVGTTKEMVESLSDKPAYDSDQNLLNRMAAKLFPHWVNYYADKKLLRLPGDKIILLEACGLAPEHPWIPNNSKVTRIAVESPEMLRYYQRMQFPASQLSLTGAAYDDILYNARRSKTAREKVLRRLRLDNNKPLLVCAWPTDQYGSRNLPMEFPNYKALCSAWAKALAVVHRFTDFNVIIRPHPVTDPELLIEVLRPHRLHHRVTDIDTLELVPACDLFVACVSSTLRWATACGIPAINYDCYDYGYTDFDSAGGLITTNRYSAFMQAIESMTDNKEAYQAARVQQQACAKEWGLQDGDSMKRIITLIGELAPSSTPPTPSNQDNRP